MNPEFHRCAHPGCQRWALRRRPTCAAHAGLDDEPFQPLAAWPASVPQPDWLAPIGAFDLVLAQRDSLHRYLRLRPHHHPPHLTQDLAHLRALSLTATDIAPTLEGATAGDQIEAFLASVSRKIFADAGWEAQP